MYCNFTSNTSRKWEYYFTNGYGNESGGRKGRGKRGYRLRCINGSHQTDLRHYCLVLQQSVWTKWCIFFLLLQRKARKRGLWRNHCRRNWLQNCEKNWFKLRNKGLTPVNTWYVVAVLFYCVTIEIEKNWRGKPVNAHTFKLLCAWLLVNGLW